MHLVLCHMTADFDTLGAAVGAVRLRPGSRIVLASNAHPTVQDFLAIWRDEYPLIERRSVDFDQVRSLTLVDASTRDRFGPIQDWFLQADQAALPITIYDHHMSAASGEHSASDFPTAEVHIEAVGAATTLIAEALQQQSITPTPFEATVMALGIHSDTGSLSFEQSTPRDAGALAWLMAQGANQQVISENKEPRLSLPLQDLLSVALRTIETDEIRGHQLGWLMLPTTDFVPGLSGLAEKLFALLGLDTLLLCSRYQTTHAQKAVVIGRSRTNPLSPDSSVDLRPIFEPFGGGGHAQAASAVLKEDREKASRDDSAVPASTTIAATFDQMLADIRAQIPMPLTAEVLMTSPVRTIRPATSVDEAQRLLLRYGHSGLCVVSAQAELVGIVSRRDIDIALRHGLGHAPVKGCMSRQLKTITIETPITQIQDAMMTHDIGRLPVLKDKQLVGIVTRTDLLRQLHQSRQYKKGLRQTNTRAQSGAPNPKNSPASSPPPAATLYQQLQSRISAIWPALMLIADIADQEGWALYLVGGAVRDLLLSQLPEPQQQCHPLTDIDLVVDGAGEGAGVALAKAIQARYSEVSLQVHGQFQTASLVWHSASSSTSSSTSASEVVPAPLLLDIATARTEFYPYPAANPEVEASSIRQDLQRRDFSINAMAIRLNGGHRENEEGRFSHSHRSSHFSGSHGSESGQLLDYFGGWLDLQKSYLRVLHNNSFIEDPTRIFRAVRFAVRLGFAIEPQTEQFIRYAISSGVYAQIQSSEDKAPALQTRLKAELKYMLDSEQWEACLLQISRLGALACLHSTLEMKPALWRQLRRMARWFSKFDKRYLAKVQPCWLMLLELMIAQLEPEFRDRIADNLVLGGSAKHRLKNLHLWEADLLKKLPKTKRPSQIYSLLQQHDLADLLLMGDRYPYTLGPQIWQYIVRLSHQPALINGGDLKQLGYPPGPQFREILTAVNSLSLDGELMSSQDAIAYVLAHYPLAPPLT